MLLLRPCFPHARSPTIFPAGQSGPSNRSAFHAPSTSILHVRTIPLLSCARHRCRPPISDYPAFSPREITTPAALTSIIAATRTRASAPTTGPAKTTTTRQRGWHWQGEGGRHRRPKITRRPHKSLRLPSPPSPRSAAPALPPLPAPRSTPPGNPSPAGCGGRRCCLPRDLAAAVADPNKRGLSWRPVSAARLDSRSRRRSCVKRRGA